jgi:small basic protein (TIGR04137 family)
MSIHPSLSSSDKNKKQRSVLKRIERLKLMADKENWKAGDNVFGLPKIKTLKIKIKKEKAAAEKTDATAAAAPAAGTAPAAEKGGAKAPAAKGAEKK